MSRYKALIVMKFIRSQLFLSTIHVHVCTSVDKLFVLHNKDAISYVVVLKMYFITSQFLENLNTTYLQDYLLCMANFIIHNFVVLKKETHLKYCYNLHVHVV